MAKTVDDGFSTFLGWLTPSITETANAKSHRASIKACLEANFAIKRFFRTGSFGNGTSVSGYSDVDYLASVPRDKLKVNSNTILEQMRKVLDNRFPNTGVHIDGPAVVVPFGDDPSETTEIVPGDYVDDKNGFYVYDIPDGSGGWMRSSPELHNDYVDSLNKKFDGEAEPLIRFVKAWKYYNDVPISSFYLEMFVAKYLERQTTIWFNLDLKYIFSNLLSSNLSPFPDPKGISGNIIASKNDADRRVALEEVKKAVSRSESSASCENRGNTQDVFYWLNRIYDDGFPKYY